MDYDFISVASELRLASEALLRASEALAGITDEAVKAAVIDTDTTGATMDTPQGDRPGIRTDDTHAGATIETVRAALSALQMAGHKDEAKALVRRYGAKLSEIAPENYDSLLADAMSVASSNKINLEVL